MDDFTETDNWLEIDEKPTYPQRYDRIKKMVSIQMIQDELIRQYRSGLLDIPVATDYMLQEWIDCYENEIKDLDLEAIKKKYKVEFFEPTSADIVQICY